MCSGRLGWWVGTVFLSAAWVAAATASADGWQGKNVLARAAEVRFREGPDERAAVVPAAVPAVWFGVMEVRGDWLRLEHGWVRQADVVGEDDAVEHFTAAIERAPSAFAYIGRCRAYSEAEEFDKALADAEEALRLDPQSAAAFDARAVVWRHKNECERSIADCEQALRLDPNFSDALRHRAVAYIILAREDDALTDLNEAVRLAPKRAYHYLDRANLYVGRGENEAALRDIEQALALRPQNALALSARATCRINLGDYDRALDDCNAALAVDGELAGAYSNRAAARAGKGQLAEARADADEALQLEPDLSHAHWVRGVVSFKENKLAEARADFEAAVRLKENAIAYSYLGQVHVREGRYDEALDAFNCSLALNPQNAPDYWRRAEVWDRKDDPANADADLSGYLRLRPDNADAYEQRGRIRTPSDAEGAIEDFTTALRLEPNRISALVARAEAFSYQQKYDRAIEDCNAALKIDPKSAMALAGRGEVCYHQGEPEKAIADYTAALGHDPNAAYAYIGRADVYLQQGKYREAVDDCQAAVRLEPGRPDYWRRLASSHAVTGDDEAAIADFTEVLRLNPRDTESLSQRGIHLTALNRFEAALADFEAALKLSPDDALPKSMQVDVWISRGREHERTGDRQAAVNDYAEALKIDPRNKIALRLRAQLLGFSNQLDAALADYDALLKLDPDDGDLYFMRAQALSMNGRDDAALADLEQGLRLADADTRPMVEQTLAWLLATCPADDLRDGKRALSLAEAFLKHAGEHDSEACRTLAAAHAENGNFAEAVRWQTKTLELVADEEVRPWFEEQLALYRAGKPYREPRGTVIVGQPVLGDQATDESSAGRIKNGLVHAARGEYDEALADINAAIQGEPKQARYYARRAAVHKLMDDFDAAVEDYSEASKLDPQNPELLANRASLLARLGKLDAALADYDAALKLTPDDALTYLMRAQSLQQHARYAAARDELEQALSLSDEDTRPAIELALAWLLATCPDAEVRDGRRAVEFGESILKVVGKRSPIACQTLAAAHAENGDLSEAVRWQTKALEAAGEDKALLGWLEEQLALYKANQPYHEPAATRAALEGAGASPCALRDAAILLDLWTTRHAPSSDHEAMVEDCSEALRVDPRNTAVIAQRALSFGLLNRLDAALIEFDSALQLEPDNAWTYFTRSMTFSHHRRHAEQLSDLEKALSLADAETRPQVEQSLVSLLATCPKAELRDGKRAVSLAESLLRGTEAPDTEICRAAAAAYAEVCGLRKSRLSRGLRRFRSFGAGGYLILAP